MSKIDWNNLNKDERWEYMRLQMSQSHTTSGGMLPDDCSDCAACGEPMLGSGWCKRCCDRWVELRRKLEGKTK